MNGDVNGRLVKIVVVSAALALVGDGVGVKAVCDSLINGGVDGRLVKIVVVSATLALVGDGVGVEAVCD